MFVHTLFRRILFLFFFSIFSFLCMLLLFSPIFNTTSLFLPFTMHPIDIVKDYPTIWHRIKQCYLLIHVLANLIYANFFYGLFFRKEKQFSSKRKQVTPPSGLCLFIGNTSEALPIYLSESSLYQNILITGTIGSGKTSCAIYPFTKQLIEYQANSSEDKLGMLILDVKGNYYKQVKTYAKQCHRQEDVIVIELRWFYSLQSFR